MQRLPGFRDYYPEDCAFRNYLFENWRGVARSFGFQEYDGPTLEPTELYKKKSGEELKTQLFRFIDQGERDVCMKPEMTPTLARLIAARERDIASRLNGLAFLHSSDLKNRKKAGSGNSIKSIVISLGTI